MEKRLILLFMVCLMCACKGTHTPSEQMLFHYRGAFEIEDPDAFKFDRSSYDDNSDPYGVYSRKNGIVPDAETAAHLSEIILYPIYGKENIVSQRPYEVDLYNGRYWCVQGTLSDSPYKEGGVFHIIIDKKDGKVCRIWHEK